MPAEKVISLDRFIIEQERLYPEATGRLSNIMYDITLAAKVVAAEVRRAGLVDILGKAGRTNIHAEEVAKDSKVKIVVLLEYGLPQERILSKARELDTDLIIFGQARGRGTRGRFLDKFLQQVLEHAPCPVLVVK